METSGLKRSGLDQFYTSDKACSLCIRELLDNIPIREYSLIIEPSAGKGIFIDTYRKYDMRPWLSIRGFDIDPKHPEVIKQDYLSLKIQIPEKGKVLVLGNPPFGRNSSLAKKFIKKSCSYAHTIAFILPKSFRKPSFEKTFDLYFHKIVDIELPKNSFILNDKPHDVPCIFQVWVKQNTQRFQPETLIPNNNYFFTNTSFNTAFRRVGVNSGQFIFDTSVLPNLAKQSHYFLSLPENFISFIKDNPPSFASANDTVGPKSISKQVLIEYLNSLK